jgi:hypothetical protein
MTGINYQGALNQAKEVADFLESEAKNAVESYFAKPPLNPRHNDSNSKRRLSIEYPDPSC